nr:glutamate carboxypeptidase [Rhodoferax sp.]
MTKIRNRGVLGLALGMSMAYGQSRDWELRASQAEKPAVLKTMETLVNMDSGTDDGKGLALVEAELVRRLKALGAEVEITAAPPSVGKVVVGRILGKGTAKIMLMIHYDTVFGVGEAGKRPFRVEGQRAYGPGVADAKGGLALILHAVGLLKAQGFDRYGELTLLFNPDEEKSSIGSREAIRKFAPQQDAVLIFEPPEAEKVIIATNGISFVNLQVKGLASHAGSAPEKGRNAAMELAFQVLQLGQLGDPVKGTTVNWTVMSSGDRSNIIPEAGRATADMRMSDLSEVERVQRDADRITQKKFMPENEVQVKVEYRRPPFQRNPQTEQLAKVANGLYGEIGKSLEPVAMRYGTDAGFAFTPNAAKPVVLDGLGVVGDRIHSSEEFVDTDSIAPRLYLTMRLIQQLSK